MESVERDASKINQSKSLKRKDDDNWRLKSRKRHIKTTDKQCVYG